MAHDITDPGDFCRACGGRGGHWDDTDRGTKILEPCYLCRGSGYSTVRVDPALQKARKET